MKKNNSVTDSCRCAKLSCNYVAQLNSTQKNAMLDIIAEALTVHANTILRGNATDLEAARDKPKHFLDRLLLDEDRIRGIGEGVRKLIALDDPIGEVKEDWSTDNGLHIVKVRVPLGVIGIIYEARPNVTVDTIALCLKTGNAVVLRGSKDALNSNRAIVDVIKTALENNGYNSDFIQLLEDTSHEGADMLMKCREFVDVLIPRGSAALIRAVVENASIPVIETGAGNCHEYIEKSADLRMAEEILLNGKLQRPSVCNALEKLLIDRAIARTVLPGLIDSLRSNGVEVRGCSEACAICPSIVPATEDDYFEEYNALILTVKVVDDFRQAIDWINVHGTHHSEVIITQNAEIAETFLNEVDSAAVYVNASTRFTDGFEFGFGAEMGISTQKLHARGPLGLRQLTSEKYKIYGNGQVRK